MRLQQEVARALHAAEVRAAIERDGGEVVGGTPAELQALLERDVERFAQLVRLSGARGD
jgi:tripartite-type tricarboxylate transporter receptor subunit TctC